MIIRKIRGYLRWLRPTNKIDAYEFLNSWEKNYGQSHDPNPNEIVQRFQILFERPVDSSETAQRDPIRLAEIGAGYGRISEVLVSEGFDMYLIEPNVELYQHLEIKFPSDRLFNCSAINLPKLPVSAYFSCRALEYCGLIELYILLSTLKRIGVPLISWERPFAGKRIRLIARISGNPRVFTQDLLR